MRHTRTTWREEILEALEEAGERWDDVVHCTLSDEELDKPFTRSHGGSIGINFGLWTHEHVYFACLYDGDTWASYVPRHPNADPIDYQCVG